jgi:hypothetical protein
MITDCRLADRAFARVALIAITLKPTVKKRSILFCLVTCLVLTGCNRYFTPVTGTTPSIDSIKNYIEENRYLVLRDPSAAYEMKNIKLDEVPNELHCDLRKIKGFRPTRGLLRIKNPYYETTRPDSAKINQIHLHTNLHAADDSAIRADIPVSSIFSVEELTYDRRKTTRHNVGTALGITACATFAIIVTVSVLNAFKDWGN